MPTFKQSLIERFEQFSKSMISLLEKSSIGPSVNTEDSPVVLIGPHYPWRDLDQKAKRFQTEIYNEYQHLIEIGRTFLVNALPENRKQLEDDCKLILEMIEQKYLTWYKNIEDAKTSFGESLDAQVEALNSVHGKIGEGRLLIPDTNVFIKNPNLHKFKLPERSNILILPTILSELDRLKVEHNNENVRQKAQTAVRNIKEYRRRGKLLDGVKITDRLSAYTIAVEPRFEGKPSWLDPNNKDDRFIATCFEVAAKFPDSDVAILTLDINMQNKAEFALFPYLDPEESGFF